MTDQSPLQSQTNNCADCKGPIGCTKCLKGGFPVKSEVSTFLTLIFLALAIVFGVLFIQEKREMASLKRTQTPAQQNARAGQPALDFKLPAPRTYGQTIALPKPQLTGGMPVQTALAERRTRRVFSDKKVTLKELGQTLWAAQGITEPKTGKRTAPSARETYFYTVFVAVKNVDGLEPGLYEYLPKEHALGKMAVADISAALTASGVQAGAQSSPVVFFLSAAYGKAGENMKASAQSSALLEAGHIGQNIYLQAESLGMATVVMAGFDAKKVGTALQLDPAETAVYVIPFGNRGVEVPVEEKPAVKED